MADIIVHVDTKFGCKCGCCFWECFGFTGRSYPVKIKSTDQVASIYDAMTQLNPMMKPGFKLMRKAEMLEPEKRIVQYSLQEGDHIQMLAAPHYCCKSPFRSDPYEKIPVAQRKELWATPTSIFVGGRPVERPPWVPEPPTNDAEEIERRKNAV